MRESKGAVSRTEVDDLWTAAEQFRQSGCEVIGYVVARAMMNDGVFYDGEYAKKRIRLGLVNMLEAGCDIRTCPGVEDGTNARRCVVDATDTSQIYDLAGF